MLTMGIYFNIGFQIVGSAVRQNLPVLPFPSIKGEVNSNS